MSGLTNEYSATSPVTNALDKISKETMAVLDRHIAAMSSNDVDIITSDYSDDVILLLSFVPQPLVGKEAQKQFLAQLLKDRAGQPRVEPKFLRKEAVGEYAYLIAEAGDVTVTETYVVRNDKVVFESVTMTPKAAPAS